MVLHPPRNEREQRTVAHICTRESHLAASPKHIVSFWIKTNKSPHPHPSLSLSHSHSQVSRTRACTARNLHMMKNQIVGSYLFKPLVPYWIPFEYSGNSLSLPVLHKQPSMSIVFWLLFHVTCCPVTICLVGLALFFFLNWGLEKHRCDWKSAQTSTTGKIKYLFHNIRSKWSDRSVS